eukprot:3484288-Rhodomonas_salina.2
MGQRIRADGIGYRAVAEQGVGAIAELGYEIVHRAVVELGHVIAHRPVAEKGYVIERRAVAEFNAPCPWRHPEQGVGW